MSEHKSSDRKSIDQKHKWDLRPIYSSIEEWTSARDEIKSQIDSINQFRKKVMESSKHLADTLSFVSDLQQKLRKLSCYASLSSDEDTRISRSEEHTSELQSRGHLVCRLL